MNPLNVLISLHQGYGLGDAVQMSAVLRHVAKYRPHWVSDFIAEEGRHQVGEGLVNRHFAYGSEPQDVIYDAEVQILLYDTWANWHDRPNTRVSSCLHERFGLNWDPYCARYKVNVGEEAMERARVLMHPQGRVGDKLVAVHYMGDSSPSRKNLTHEQADGICKAIEELGGEPIVLDWRRQCLLYRRRISAPQEWGGNAEMVCAVIRQCKAFIGIDSGPAKCASSTDVPALVIWTGHHPAPFHDPAPNTTHLVPWGYHGLEPVCNDRGVIEWFEAHYNVRNYWPNPVPHVRKWLEEVLE